MLGLETEGVVLPIRDAALADVVAVEPTSYMRWVLWFRRLLQRAQDRLTVVDGSAESEASNTAVIRVQ